MSDDLFAALLARLESREARVGIVGMGYVGLPLMLAATGAGYDVLGFDVDAAKVEGLNRGESPLKHIGDGRVAAAVAGRAEAEKREAGRFEATGDFARIKEVEAVLLCVPTPLGAHREPDLSFVEATCRSLAPHLEPGSLVVLESTTYPGTTREIMAPILEARGLVAEETLFMAYSPEREDPGNLDFTTSRIPKVIGAVGAKALALAEALYRPFIPELVAVSSPETAEAVKLTENIFRAVNIALVNELKLAFQPMGIDIFEVIEAAASKPFGFMPFYPGPGLGGHCIPIDPFYLTWKAREHGIATRFIELAGEVNTAMPAHVVATTALALDREAGLALSRAKVLVLGVAYKKNIDDTRESPALEILALLEARGAETEFHDPHVAAIPATRRHPSLAGRRSLPLDEATLATFDAVILVTDHDALDYALIARAAHLVIDSRGRFRGLGDSRGRSHGLEDSRGRSHGLEDSRDHFRHHPGRARIVAA